MSLSFNLPTPSEKAEMLQDNDKVGLFIARIAWGLVIVSFIFGIIALLGCKWAWVASAIGWSLTGIALIIFSDIRGTFKYKKQEKDKMEQKLRLDRINERAGVCFEASKNWIENTYADGHFHTKGKRDIEYNKSMSPHTIEPGEKYEIGEMLTINFEDFKEIEPDKEIRKLCFD